MGEPFFVVRKDGKFVRSMRMLGHPRTRWGKLLGALLFTKPQAANVVRDFGGEIVQVRGPSSQTPELVEPSERTGIPR